MDVFALCWTLLCCFSSWAILGLANHTTPSDGWPLGRQAGRQLGERGRGGKAYCLSVVGSAAVIKTAGVIDAASRPAIVVMECMAKWIQHTTPHACVYRLASQADRLEGGTCLLVVGRSATDRQATLHESLVTGRWF
mmetsp:Transcript_26586/g.66115  ORF Transcript_26586/g.66115 Transcript_26586/m.66115 type:complete len:137 (-) Transcript_26586:109-519(-)